MDQKRHVSIEKRLFFVYSTRQKFGANFTILGPKRADGPETARFQLKNGLFLVYGTIAEIRCFFGPKRADGPETAHFH